MNSFFFGSFFFVDFFIAIYGKELKSYVENIFWRERMNSKIDYLIGYVKRGIPPEILRYAFFQNTGIGEMRANIDWMIRSSIIDGWVMKDCNVLGGVECFIDITGCKQEHYPGGTLVKISDSQTGGKIITSVLGVSFSMGSYYQSAMGNEIVNAVDGPNLMGSCRVWVVGDNTVYFEGGLLSTMRWLRVVVENDKDFGNISDKSLTMLGELCLLACRAFIYNNKIIDAENQVVIQGLPMGRLTDIINEWSNAADDYRELRDTKLRRMLFLNDGYAKNRHIRMLLVR